MEFERSTHARSWMFSRASLAACRDAAVSIDNGFDETLGRPRVRKFASGFHRRRELKAVQRSFLELRTSSSLYSEIQNDISENKMLASNDFLSMVSPTEQETLVQFHAHQISLLVGPHAILSELRRSNTVLATAIMIFRRFFLSNSILQFKPRPLAAASALLAAKMEESQINIRYLVQATKIISRKVRTAPVLCRKELESVPIGEIEVSERNLLEGLNYECRCFHPFGAVKALSFDIARTFFSNKPSQDEERDAAETFRDGSYSPRSVSHGERKKELSRQVYVKSMDIAQKASLFSDVPFLFSPGKIAFAAIRIAQNQIKPSFEITMEDYLRVRFPGKSDYELMCFKDDVSQIVSMLEENKAMGLGLEGERCKSTGKKQPTLASQADELRKVMEKVYCLHRATSVDFVGKKSHEEKITKRKFEFPKSTNCADEVNHRSNFFKIPKVTPNNFE